MAEQYQDLAECARAMRAWAKKLGWRVHLAVWKVAAEAPNIIRQTSARMVPRPKASGAYEAGWTYRRSSKGAVVFSPVKHASFVEGGRRRGARMPPVSAIAAWMRLKGIEGGMGRAYVIARAISRRGIKPRPVLARSMPEIRKRLRSEMAKLVR